MKFTKYSEQKEVFFLMHENEVKFMRNLWINTHDRE